MIQIKTNLLNPSMNCTNEIIELLTNREKEVLQLLAKGLSQKEVAYKLYISYHTMVTHKNNIQRKLNAKSCFQLGVIAERHKLLEQ